MYQRNRSRKKIIAGAALILLAAAGIIWGVFASKAFGRNLSETVVVEKDSSKERGTPENPLFILEIVPDIAQSEIGWLIPGCEPIGEEGLADLSVNKQNLGTFLARFTNQDDAGKSAIVTAELKKKYSFADEIPEESKICKNGDTLEGEKLPQQYEEITDPSEYGVWVYCKGEDSTGLSGYYEKTGTGEGLFCLERTETENGQISYEFVTDSEGKGNYIWHTAENEENAETDYEADKVWTVRAGKHFAYSYYVFTHNDNLIQHSFGKTSEEFKTIVKTLTPEDFLNSNNLKLMDQADMIYIHRSHDQGLISLYEKYHQGITAEYDSFRQNDFTWDMVARIMERQNSKDPAAVVVDRSAMQGKEADNSVISNETNVNKLFLMLTQFGPRYFYDVFQSEITAYEKTDEAKGSVSSYSYQNKKEWDEATFITEENKKDIMVPYYPMETGVVDHVYIYNGDMSMLDKLLTGNYRENEKNDNRWHEVFDYYEETTGHRQDSVNTNDIIKYLFNGFDQTKTKLSILELQPCNKFIYGSEGWRAYYRSLFPWFTGSLDTDLTVTAMPVWQLNGSIQDLNASYDMIIIGSNQDISNGGKGYHDWRLNTAADKGAVYTGTGDMVLAEGTQKDYNGVPFHQSMRYSGNDITIKKQAELKAFLNGGKPVVMASELYYDGTSNVSADKFDKSSNMYGFAQMYRKNPEGVRADCIFVKNQITVAGGEAAALKKILSRENCRLEFYTQDGNTGYPKEYTYEEDGTGAIASVSGLDTNRLAFRFCIRGSLNQTYGVRLLADIDSDGIYKQEREQLKGISVVDEAGSHIPPEALKTDCWYTLTYEIGSSLTGIIPWKLEVYDISNGEIRDSETNYTLAPVSAAKRKKIKILQMNLSKDMDQEAEGAGTFLRLDQEERFQTYSKSVKEYKIQAEFLENAEWSRKFAYKGTDRKEQEKKLQEWKDFLEEYDMMILGFADQCIFTDNTVFYEGFQEFIDRGKSVILSHDIGKDTSGSGLGTGNTTAYDGMLRDLLGQRRYTDQNSVSINGYGNTSLLHGDARYNDTTKEGIVLPGIFDNSHKLYAVFGDPYFCDRDTFAAGESEYSTNYVNLTNYGQITEYPFDIPQVIAVSDTHAQNYQLNLEQGEEADTVVWCSLTDRYTRNYREAVGSLTGAGVSEEQAGRGFYSSRENDAANSYYVYRKGSITYTGLGHQTREGVPEQEMKLFINTVVASYQAAPERPGTEVTNPEVYIKGNETTLYLTLDEENFSYEGAMYDVHFRVKDESVIDTSGRSYILRYEDENGNPALMDTYEETPEGKQQITANANGTYNAAKDGTYSFLIPYEQIIGNGYAQYRLITESDYTDSKGKEIHTQSVNNINVYIIPLFPLR